MANCGRKILGLAEHMLFFLDFHLDEVLPDFFSAVPDIESDGWLS